MSQRKVLAVLEDLFFSVKINESAKRSGFPVEFVKSEVDALEKVAVKKHEQREKAAKELRAFLATVPERGER